MDKRLSDQTEHVSMNTDPKDPKEQYDLGFAYKFGIHGFKEDEEKAQYWFGKALEQYLQLAQNGDTDAMAQLVEFYQYGYGTKQDIQKAVEWCRKAAEAGDAESQYQMGWFFGEHPKVERNDEESFSWYLKAAEQGHVKAMDEAGLCYYEGKGTAKDYEKAEYWLKKCADLGDEDALVDLRILHEKRDYEKSLKKAETGDPEAQYQLAEYHNAKNERDQAALWYRKAAEQGHLKAMYELGDLLSMSQQKDDVPEGMYWLKKAAENGHDMAQYLLGKYYEEGYGVEADKKKAREWYEKASRNQNQADEYLSGKEIAEEHLHLMMLNDLREEAEKGDVSSQLKLGKLLNYEGATAHEKKEAASWYQKAAMNGSAGAGYELAASFLLAKGDYYDETNGVKVLEWAAEAGHPLAQLDLGRLYAQGKHVKRSSKQALKWLEKAADQGIPEAKEEAALMRVQIEEEKKELARKKAEEEEAAREKEAEEDRELRRGTALEINTIIAGVIFILCVTLHHWTEFNPDLFLFTKAFLLFVGAVGSVASGGALLGVFATVYKKLEDAAFILFVAGLVMGFITVFRYKNLVIYRNVRIIAAVIIVWMILRIIRKKISK